MAPGDHIKMRILKPTISGIPLLLGRGTSMSDPYDYVVFFGPIAFIRYLESLRWSRSGRKLG